MKAFLKNNRQAPRKVRLIADHVRGKNVAAALTDLSFMPQKGAKTMKKLIESAAANAKQANSSLRHEDLVVKKVAVDKGVTYVRYMPRAFGRATPINRECSHIRVELAPLTGAPAKRKAAKKSGAAKTAPPAAKGKVTARKGSSRASAKQDAPSPKASTKREKAAAK